MIMIGRLSFIHKVEVFLHLIYLFWHNNIWILTKTLKKSYLPINTFEKQVNEAKTGFQIKIIRKDDKNTSKEKKDNGNID